MSSNIENNKKKSVFLTSPSLIWVWQRVRAKYQTLWVYRFNQRGDFGGIWLG